VNYLTHRLTTFSRVVASLKPRVCPGSLPHTGWLVQTLSRQL